MSSKLIWDAYLLLTSVSSYSYIFGGDEIIGYWCLVFSFALKSKLEIQLSIIWLNFGFCQKFQNASMNVWLLEFRTYQGRLHDKIQFIKCHILPEITHHGGIRKSNNSHRHYLKIYTSEWNIHHHAVRRWRL